MSNSSMARELANGSATYDDETLLVDLYSDGVVFYAMLAADSYCALVRDWTSSDETEGKIVEHSRSDDGYCGTIIFSGQPDMLRERLSSRFQSKRLIVRTTSSDKPIQTGNSQLSRRFAA